ncbi:tRNA (adenosine(37)-N6)-threonylcarbamoyltransferase complex transferase subunit TsaD [Blattabacterium cuenoti]|uniref:tRNA (adenosine(37)-N6)-threonylcarbamoyltransferase complex transferase subunit TsaD n=1 Tax=Blattabacterium cuenoti TaxID=1653831 RepID=UPI00163C18A2|nr:tRNA (adenosine(37)-N6)-threonylcarbamoyltransferase complex transferase subunit TsaD [Blattabacterium cuenoti]
MKYKKDPIIIGIESSCDDSAVSIIRSRKILSNVIIGQNIHKKYGGIVPELAARLHDKNLLKAIDKSIKLANIKKYQIDAVSFTIGPGLIGSLLIGCSLAKSLAIGLNIPIITVDHIQAHTLIHFIENGNINNSYPNFPFLSLVISGGHTLIIKVDDYLHMKVLGSTLDNPIGEVFDKIARKFGFSYPGGVFIEKYSKYGNFKKFKFPKPLVKGLNFSFSGLKSYIFRFIDEKLIKDPNFLKKNLFDLCASIQNIIIDILIEKIHKAVIKTKINRITLSGGVSSNERVKKVFLFQAKKNNWNLFIPNNLYTNDNGAMIAITGMIKYHKKQFNSLNVTPYSKFKYFIN